MQAFLHLVRAEPWPFIAGAIVFVLLYLSIFIKTGDGSDFPDFGDIGDGGD